MRQSSQPEAKSSDRSQTPREYLRCRVEGRSPNNHDECSTGKATGQRSETSPQLFAETLGLADQFLVVRGPTTLSADVRAATDILLEILEVGLHQLLQFAKRSGH